MVMEFYELCTDIWAGCPGTVPIEGGLESITDEFMFQSPGSSLVPKENRSAIYNTGKKLEKRISAEKQLIKLSEKELQFNLHRLELGGIQFGAVM